MSELLPIMSEEYDLRSKRLAAGNFPQALSHIALINTAYKLLSLGNHNRHEAGSPRAMSAEQQRANRAADTGAQLSE